MPDNSLGLERLRDELGLDSVEEAARIRSAVERCEQSPLTRADIRREPRLHVEPDGWTIRCGDAIVGQFSTPDGIRDAELLRTYTTIPLAKKE